MNLRIFRGSDPVHRTTQELLPWYVNGTLEGGERAQVEAHLSACLPCRRELEAQRAQQTRRGGPTPASAPSSRLPITVSFTDDELNAFFDKWITWNNWKAAYERHMIDPILILDDGRLILAGRIRELESVVSLHFEPRIDPRDAERLRRRGRTVSAHGRLPGLRRRRACGDRDDDKENAEKPEDSRSHGESLYHERGTGNTPARRCLSWQHGSPRFWFSAP